jgi:hypothetical protein
MKPEKSKDEFGDYKNSNAIFQPAKLQENSKKSKDTKKDTKKYKISPAFICLVSIAIFLFVLLLSGIIVLIIALNVSSGSKEVTLNCGMPAIAPVIDYSNKIYKIINGDEAVSHSFPWMVYKCS